MSVITSNNNQQTEMHLFFSIWKYLLFNSYFRVNWISKPFNLIKIYVTTHSL